MAVALKAAIPIALIVAVAADMLIATEAGIGKVIMDAMAVFDTPRMYAAVIIVGLLGYLAAVLGTSIERLAIHWSGR
jgi:NitT/TauT family transport system permease protein